MFRVNPGDGSCTALGGLFRTLLKDENDDKDEKDDDGADTGKLKGKCPSRLIPRALLMY